MVRKSNGDIACYTADTSETRAAPELTLQGTFPASALPSGNALGHVPMFVVTHDTTQRAAIIDFYALGGRYSRG